MLVRMAFTVRAPAAGVVPEESCEMVGPDRGDAGVMPGRQPGGQPANVPRILGPGVMATAVGVELLKEVFECGLELHGRDSAIAMRHPQDN
jgi:hypothetical protein